MNVEPVDSLMNKIMSQYNKKPEGWTVLIDRKGNMLILNPRVGYRLKLVPLNPREYTGVGVKLNSLNEMQKVTEGVPSYGFRPLSNMDTEELLTSIHQGSAMNKLIEKFLMMPPVSTMELQKKPPKTILSGPVIAHPNLNAISKSQQKLEKKLTIEAYKLFEKKYPHRAAMYR